MTKRDYSDEPRLRAAALRAAALRAGLRRARAAILLMLALPGSAYLYQGEELGLHEVPDIPGDEVQDPVFSRSPTPPPG